jgi:hypothetical protein
LDCTFQNPRLRMISLTADSFSSFVIAINLPDMRASCKSIPSRISAWRYSFSHTTLLLSLIQHALSIDG